MNKEQMIDKGKLLALQKKGQVAVNSKVTALVGVLVLAILVSVLGPEIFNNLIDLNNSANVPDYVYPILSVLVAVGMIFLLWRAFS